MPFDMANVGPKSTGVDAIIHIFQDVDRRGIHGPRIKVFPGSPRAGDATVISVPTHPTVEARVIGKVTVSRKVLKQALKFVELNWPDLALYWFESEYSTHDLLDNLLPVE